MNPKLRVQLVTAATLLFGGSLWSQCLSISCPGNITVSAPSNACVAQVNFATPVGVNNCTTSGTQTFNMTGSLQTFTVPAGVTSLSIDCRGAQGGSVTTACAATGGLGARMTGTFAVTPGEVLTILVGEQGLTNGSDAGGGGGSFVVRTGNIPLVVAGGGGGATNNINACGSNRNGLDATITTSGTASGNGIVAGGTAGNGGGASNGSGGGGGGFLTDGVAGTGLPGNNGKSYLNGGAGGNGNNNDRGGYGGGGAGWFTGGNGGGGGGYSGGATSGSQPFTGGGGGGSYSIGTSQMNSAGFQTGHGQVIISYSVPGPATTTQIAGLPSGSSFPLGITTQTFVVSDGSGDLDTCSFTVTVNDVTAPVITCPNSITVNNDSGICGALVNYSNPVVVELCGTPLPILTSGLPSGSVFPVGTTTVTYVVADAAGNNSNCSFQVTVNDVEAPVFTCLSNMTMNVDSGLCTAVVNFNTPTVTDNCSSPTATQIAGLPGGSAFPLGVTTVTYTATDAAGNSDTCSFTVTVVDNVAPVINCPQNITVNNIPGTCNAVVNYNTPTATDICSNATVALTAGLPSGSSFPVGTTVVNYTATDGSNNTSNCSFNVTVVAADNSTQTVSICNGENYSIGSSTYTTSGTYVDTLQNSGGCDSVVTTQLSVAPAINVNVNVTGATATAAASGATYQWIDCGNNNTPVAGATSQTFTATQGSNYAVIVTIGNCSDTSACVLVSGLGNEVQPVLFSFYPNPTSGIIQLEFTTHQNEVRVILTDVSGKLISEQQEVNVSRTAVDMAALPAGMYFIRVATANGVQTLPVMKND
ncbi:MAG: HYR domain-containing protein [Bacteroidia bacterium]|jgi:hypothetical protein|nr:HYR domain-containing protein [Bacteroidia bacterium]